MQVRLTRNHLRLMLLCAVLIAATAPAQNDDSLNDRLLACDALQNPQDRLACFNSVVEGLERPAGPEATPSPSPAPQAEAATGAEIETATEPAPEPAPVVEATPTAAPPPVVPDSPPPAPAAAKPANTAPQPEPRPAASASAPRPAAAARPEPATEESGDRRDLTGEAVIVRVWKNYDGRFTVELDNGQVWRETQGTRVGITDVGADVEITRSLFGAYRMKIDGIPQVAWIRRTD